MAREKYNVMISGVDFDSAFETQKDAEQRAKDYLSDPEIWAGADVVITVDVVRFTKGNAPINKKVVT